MKLALTGMIGSGKSTALLELRRLGWQTISTDSLADEIAKGAEAREFLKGYFQGSAPERAELRERFVKDAAFREAWEAFLHPKVRAAWEGQIAGSPQANWAVELPLVYEKRLEKAFDNVVVCSCSPDVALARWEKKGRSAKDYLALSNLLIPLQEKISRADFHLINDDGVEKFLEATRVLHARLLN